MNRERADTIRNIVSSLVGEGGDLLDENEPPQPLQMHAEDYSDPNWEPEPIDAGPGKPLLRQPPCNNPIKSVTKLHLTLLRVPHK